MCDARPVFATRARFPHADDVAADRPHRYRESTAWTPVRLSASSPTALAFGARTLDETAVPIAAEIIARTGKGTSLPLSQTAGPIHQPTRQEQPASVS
ncbi:hypothetical protein [Streptomyces regalis]|uniref:hypothetical protein n=1 Tax=Streptomyces regalis TaxID=68262 RepID=UPI00131B0D0D|nr:hypothetical protein [Streptomyces regalis]